MIIYPLAPISALQLGQIRINLFGFFAELDPDLPKKGPGGIHKPISIAFLSIIGFTFLWQN
jgi:hypothetical protein